MNPIISVEQQVAMLRPTVGFAAHLHRWLLAGAALGVVSSIVFWHPVPLMFAAFLALVGFFERKAGPNIVAAISAYDDATPTRGEVAVTISCWDTDNHYHALLREPDHPDWEYDFVPQGWQPIARIYPARIWRASSNGQPVLAVVEDGLLIPRGPPNVSAGFSQS